MGDVVGNETVALRPGARVNEHIELLRPLGAGGMGTVWVGRHLNLGTELAVKFIRGNMEFDTRELVERFEVEARAAALIKSPHVVRIFDFGVSSWGSPYLAMELLEGEALDARLARCGPMALQEASEVVRQCADVLTEAHQRGVVHRDIKPANILLCNEASGRVFTKVLDFGVAKVTGQHVPRGLTMPGHMVGTPEYLSPENLLGSGADERVGDVWALSVLAYECLAARVPFPGETPAAVILRFTGGKATPITGLRSDVGSDLDAFFERAFSPNPGDRFATAASLADAFDHALRTPGAPRVAGKQPPAVDPPPTSGIDRRWVWGGATALLALVLVSFAVGTRSLPQKLEPAFPVPWPLDGLEPSLPEQPQASMHDGSHVPSATGDDEAQSEPAPTAPQAKAPADSPEAAPSPRPVGPGAKPTPVEGRPDYGF